MTNFFLQNDLAWDMLCYYQGLKLPLVSFCSGARIGAVFDVKEFKVEIDSLRGDHGLRHSSSLANAHLSGASMVYEGHSYG
jgi:hypothetical protein